MELSPRLHPWGSLRERAIESQRRGMSGPVESPPEVLDPETVALNLAMRSPHYLHLQTMEGKRAVGGSGSSYTSYTSPFHESLGNRNGPQECCQQGTPTPVILGLACLQHHQQQKTTSSDGVQRPDQGVEKTAGQGVRLHSRMQRQWET